MIDCVNKQTHMPMCENSNKHLHCDDIIHFHNSDKYRANN